MRNEARGADGKLVGDLQRTIESMLTADLLRLRTAALRGDIVARFGCCAQTANRAVAKARVREGIRRRMQRG